MESIQTHRGDEYSLGACRGVHHRSSQEVDRHQDRQERPGEGRDFAQLCQVDEEKAVDVVGEVKLGWEGVGFDEVSVGVCVVCVWVG